MTVGFAKPRDPEKIPEHVLWTLYKGDRIAQARTRMTPLGPELRFMLRRVGDDDDLLWSQVFKDGDGANVGELADQKRREFEDRGWLSKP